MFDRLLDERPVVERDSVGHTVWVFWAVGYRVNRRLPGVYPLFREDDGRVRVGVLLDHTRRAKARQPVVATCYCYRYHQLIR